MRNSRLLLAALIAGALPALQACFPMVATGVVVGTLIATDRRITENYIADEAIESRATIRIGERFGARAHVNVTS